jgi:hypothetical protein
MDGLFSFPRNRLCDIQTFAANSPNSGSDFHIWRKRPGVTMLHIICIGGGAGGGNGAVGANSTAAGGGGGGSAVSMSGTIAAHAVPDELFVSVGFGGLTNTGGVPSRVAVYPDTSASTCIALANGGGAGGNASGVTPGTAGSAATATTQANVILDFITLVAANAQAGVAGTAASVGTSVTMPNTGLVCMGGCGGGGLPAAATPGSNGGTYTGTGSYSAPPRGLGGTGATVPGGGGSNGYAVWPGVFLFFGGTGGGSSHGSASGAGLVGGAGGAGVGPGCGGGGGGGALTGSVQGVGGRGGDGIVIITAW